ncbi:MAG: DUF1292 domain-containing protein [Clostridiales bacterium]|nr:DUF1292 domain-containing protein [Clostridiales bacterium]
MDNEKEFDNDGILNEFVDDDMDNVITLKDEETGEEFEFAYIDNFEFNDKKYCVLLTMDDEDPEMVIFEEIEDENGEITISSLDEKDEDPVYDYYDSLCDEYLDDEDESEE